jgi:NAD/NADP transhydrogenase beta subunit
VQDILPSTGASVAGRSAGAGPARKRIASLADATLGVMHTASMAVCTIGHGLAVARSLNARHAVKQVDRMLSNPGIDVDQILALWVPFGARTPLLVALDWTDFDVDNQTTIMLSLITHTDAPHRWSG